MKTRIIIEVEHGPSDTFSAERRAQWYVQDFQKTDEMVEGLYNALDLSIFDTITEVKAEAADEQR